MESAIPRQIDKYKVLELIARGGMGMVYKAVDPALDRFVAIKMVTSVDAAHRDHLKRFYREAQFTANLRHQNIVTVYGLGEFEGTPYLVMEYLSGKSLHALLAEGSLNRQQKVNCIWQVCNGLEHAHSRQPSIIHRDIKPGNIVVTDDGTAKIIDFGIARTGQSNETRTGFVMGSYPYMSPEQINAAELDGRSDIFSTGVVLYQLLTGVLPFAGPTIAETLHSVLHSTPAPVRQFTDEYPERLDAIISRALAKEREHRYQSAGEFALELQAVEQDLKRESFKTYLSQAESLLTNGEYDRAKLELAKILEIDRQDPRANELMKKALRASTRQQRKARAAQLRVRAEKALKLNRTPEALTFLDQALRLDPTNAALHAYREQVSATRARAVKLDEILTRAEKAFAADDWDEAKRAVLEALQFDSKSARAQSFLDILRGKNVEAQGPTSDRLGRVSASDFAHNVSDQGRCVAPDPIWSEVEMGSTTSQGTVDEASAGTAVAGSDAETAAFSFDSFPRELRPEGTPTSNPEIPTGHSKNIAPASADHHAKWPQDVLQAAEKQLAPFVGPMAKILVRNAAARSTDSDELCRLLAQEIEAPGNRDIFLSNMRSARNNPGSTRSHTGRRLLRPPDQPVP